MSSLKAVTDVLHSTLARAQEEREQRPGLIDGPDGPECEWAAYERARMHETVNAIRGERDLPAVPVEDIVRAEQHAVGHSDYSRKFAFYCAELAEK
ncbi:hypothetical protein [Streptomyces sp. NPDC015125]|uniref:hypothetical protein n=1 Tax=Streptomyces sp. NPDC015125 TaxID=3364938 RepID=UPI0036FD2D50